MRKPHSFIRKFQRKPLLRHRVHLSSQENSPLFRSKSIGETKVNALKGARLTCPSSFNVVTQAIGRETTSRVISRYERSAGSSLARMRIGSQPAAKNQPRALGLEFRRVQK